MNASGIGPSGPLYMSAEEAGIVEDEFTPAGTKYKQDGYGQWVPAISPGNIRGSNEHNPDERAYTELDSSFHVVTPVLKEMKDLQTRLAQRGEFDPRTGEPTCIIGGAKREALQKQLAHLTHHVLPYQMAQGREADAWLAANPTQGSAQGLQAQIDKRDAIRTQAEQIANLKEAEALAERLVAQRGR